ncbi:MAG: hypothetical protein V2A64_06110 [Candidatus Omnitrophota bacterium]
MEFKLSFRHIISHLLPGMLASLEVIIALSLIIPNFKISDIISLFGNTAMSIFLLTISGAVLGIFIDALQHYLFEELDGNKFVAEQLYKLAPKIFPKKSLIEWECLRKEKRDGKNSIKNKEQLMIYDYLVHELFYYYYEAWINLGLSLSPLLLLLPSLFKKLSVSWLWVIISQVILIIVIIILFYEGVFTYFQYSQKDDDVLDSFKGIS